MFRSRWWCRWWGWAWIKPEQMEHRQGLEVCCLLLTGAAWLISFSFFNALALLSGIGSHFCFLVHLLSYQISAENPPLLYHFWSGVSQSISVWVWVGVCARLCAQSMCGGVFGMIWMILFSVAKYFFILFQSTLSAESLTVSIQLPCAIACINICAYVKNPKHWQPHPSVDSWKCCTYWLKWVALLKNFF